jgi:hypothetical protein
MGILAKIKTFLAKYFLIIESCDRCGIRQPLVWWCEDNELYKRVTGTENGIFCPKCFDKMAEQKGIFIRWIPREEQP